jgi:hypothetical protein
MSSYLKFYFDKNDPEFFTKTAIINDSSDNFVSHVFITSPIYDTFGIKIGYKVSDDIIQQIGENKYSVKISSTYYIEGNGTITWNYAFVNSRPDPYYPSNVNNASNIVSTTGSYFGKSGAVSLIALENGRRNVVIGFNF